MKPTNHLRWIERTVEYTTPRMEFPLLQGGTHIVEEQKVWKHETILQQFWQCEDKSEYLNDGLCTIGCSNSVFGEWRDIETVKEEK